MTGLSTPRRGASAVSSVLNPMHDRDVFTHSPRDAPRIGWRVPKGLWRTRLIASRGTRRGRSPVESSAFRPEQDICMSTSPTVAILGPVHSIEAGRSCRRASRPTDTTTGLHRMFPKLAAPVDSNRVVLRQGRRMDRGLGTTTSRLSEQRMAS